MATLQPWDDFSAEDEAKKLKEAMDGLGTNEDAIIEVVGHHCCSERQEIADIYKTMYGEDLIDELKSELRGDFEDAVVAIMMPARVFDAHELRRAMKGIGTDEASLIDILCSRTNDEIEEIKELYESEFERNLEEDVQSETSGDFKRLLVSMLNAGREEDGEVDVEKADEEAQEIYEAGEDQWGTDESTFMRILSLRSYTQLRATFEAYQRISDKDMETVIEKEFSGNLKDGLLAIVRYARHPPRYFAIKLYESMKGLGTDEKTLIRVIATRAEVDMQEIKEAFEKIYEKTLVDFIDGDIRGDFKKVMLAMVGE
ncbi:hypothetical protein CAPTEDRAFT_157366 [Capitella teleta]|uniref:Annexin n=1 Tax=Capitella teleta TaxID=283909 RepID=R7TDC5_CAPTE|nr:hypothetical protein CAPTEDRAFT_157366 [Capitella teleta]|eukprot:ELT91724.1 hypothetical protein CAPTEDRAFT_157366 [Capitella teleta]